MTKGLTDVDMSAVRYLIAYGINPAHAYEVCQKAKAGKPQKICDLIVCFSNITGQYSFTEIEADNNKNNIITITNKED